MNPPQIILPIKRFLLIENCPAEWKEFDLYLFRDEHVTFYVGQSQLAFARVWEHLLGGFHGHSIVGRFIWSNWPVSMKFTIELMSSKSERFDEVGNDLDAAERQLIQAFLPCFNISLNSAPTHIPSEYRPMNAKFRFRHGLNQLKREAERAVRADDSKVWIEELN
ncbi:MAG: GIY-YIG nuclease family protein [Chloroflexi bacterium]|nr:GIY-YIG nuclease family protein [Chloroflexota bacterium]